MVGVEEYRTTVGTAENVFYCVKILYSNPLLHLKNQNVDSLIDSKLCVLYLPS